MKFTEKRKINVKLGILNKNETRHFEGIVCPHCHEEYQFKSLTRIENFLHKIYLDDVLSDGSTSSNGVECPVCNGKFNVWVDTVFYSFTDKI
jgi:hypothetical protein